jgi:lipoxygenase
MPNWPTRRRRFVSSCRSWRPTQTSSSSTRCPADRFTTTLGFTLIEVLSPTTPPTKLYLGQRATAAWIDDGEVLQRVDGK